MDSGSVGGKRSPPALNRVCALVCIESTHRLPRISAIGAEENEPRGATRETPEEPEARGMQLVPPEAAARDVCVRSIGARNRCGTVGKTSHEPRSEAKSRSRAPNSGAPTEAKCGTVRGQMIAAENNLLVFNSL